MRFSISDLGVAETFCWKFPPQRIVFSDLAARANSFLKKFLKKRFARAAKSLKTIFRGGYFQRRVSAAPIWLMLKSTARALGAQAPTMLAAFSRRAIIGNEEWGPNPEAPSNVTARRGKKSPRARGRQIPETNFKANLLLGVRQISRQAASYCCALTRCSAQNFPLFSFQSSVFFRENV